MRYSCLDYKVAIWLTHNVQVRITCSCRSFIPAPSRGLSDSAGIHPEFLLTDSSTVFEFFSPWSIARRHANLDHDTSQNTKIQKCVLTAAATCKLQKISKSVLKMKTESKPNQPNEIPAFKLQWTRSLLSFGSRATPGELWKFHLGDQLITSRNKLSAKTVCAAARIAFIGCSPSGFKNCCQEVSKLSINARLVVYSHADL